MNWVSPSPLLPQIGILFMAFLNLVFAIKFGPSQTAAWLVSVAIGCVADFFVFEPLSALVFSSLSLLVSSSKRGLRRAVFDGIAAHAFRLPEATEKSVNFKGGRLGDGPAVVVL
jgi:hypothetical protein